MCNDRIIRRFAGAFVLLSLALATWVDGRWLWFTAFVGFSPQAETGLAALANTTPSLRNNFVQAAYCLLTSLVGEALDDRPAHRTPEPVVQTPAVFNTQPPKNAQASALRAPHLAP